MFLSRNKKIMYTPVNPSFIIQKWGLRGSKLYRHVFVMDQIFLYANITIMLQYNEKSRFFFFSKERRLSMILVTSARVYERRVA